jgi:nucleoid-associated protein YgaU
MKAITTAAVLALLATGGIAMAQGSATAPAASSAPATATTAPVEAKKDAMAPAAPVDAKKAKKGKKHKM